MKIKVSQELKRLALAASLLCMCAISLRAHAAEPWPQIALPPKAQVQWVGQSMRVNGVPTRIMQFQSRASRSEIVEYYRAQWSGAYERSPSVKPLGEATVIGQMHGPYLMNIKVEDAARGASQGVISVSQIIGFKEDRDPGALPMVGGAHVVQVVESDDPGKHSREVVIVAPQSSATVTQFYQAWFKNAGWQQVQANLGLRSGSGGNGSFIAFARGAEEMQMTVVEDSKIRGAQIVANLVTKDTGDNSN